MNGEEEKFISFRKEVPAHYILKIESFSLLAMTQMEKYVSGDFKAGGYNWKLILYPNGNKERNVKDHISLYLAISEPSSLPVGWQANVMFKLFVFSISSRTNT